MSDTTRSLFCSLPFTHIGSLNNGFYRTCCYTFTACDNKTTGKFFNMRTDPIDQVWNSDFYKQLRLDLINNVKNKNCESCWKLEESNSLSGRLKETNINDLNEYADVIAEATANNGAIITTPANINIRIGNLCNLKCIMCGPVSSNLHQEELELIKSKGIKLPSLLALCEDKNQEFNSNVADFVVQPTDTINQLIDNLDSAFASSDLKSITLVGGDPLINKMVHDLIEYYDYRNYSKDISIGLISNLSVVNPRLFNLLNQFKTINLTASWDHVDPAKFNFIRYPADYAQFRRNYDIVSTEYPNINLEISTTWGIFNAFDFEQLLSYWEALLQTNKDFRIILSQIDTPNYFSLRYLELDQKQELSQRIQDFLTKNKDWLVVDKLKTRLENFVTLMGTENQPDHDEVCIERSRVLDIYDKIRNTDYKSLFPYIRNYNY